MQFVNEQNERFFNKSDLCVKERIQTFVYDSPEDVSLVVAQRIVDLIKEKESKNELCVLGLATGSTPTKVYSILCEMFRKGEVSFRNVVSFNLDEYYPMDRTCQQSYYQFMHQNLFRHIDILKENINIPDGECEFNNLEEYCQKYEDKIKSYNGIDLQLLGIGKTGHIGFNEPGSQLDSITRLIYLDKITKADAASDFFDINNVPRKAITMGLKTIMNSKQIILIALGEGKSQIIKKTVENDMIQDIPASCLQKHKNCYIFVDSAASVDLTRFSSPWLIKGATSQRLFDYDKYMTVKAVVWLSQTLNKSIFKLIQEDYEKNGLYGLMEKYNNNVEQINNLVVNQLNSVITHTPAGLTKSQKILIFSPHPDDDVICMGGTMQKLVQQGQQVFVAYQTSGSIGVFDHDVYKYNYFLKAFLSKYHLQDKHQQSQPTFSLQKDKSFQKDNTHHNKENLPHNQNKSQLGQQDSEFRDLLQKSNKVQQCLDSKQKGEGDNKVVLEMKGLIRQAEAVRAAVVTGVKEEDIYFLNMPFYETGQIKKSLIKNEDISLVQNLISRIQPDQIYMAGDLTDPHGTHRQCSLAVLIALENIKKQQYQQQGNNNNKKKDKEYEVEECKVLLYRGAWQEWEIEKCTMVVPLTPQEVYLKKMAIFKHQSQKDLALFPGSDKREFWQRAHDRNLNTANLYSSLGLNNYQALEVFVHYDKALHAFT